MEIHTAFYNNLVGLSGLIYPVVTPQMSLMQLLMTYKLSPTS